ncbi:sphingomyelin synthase [Podila humilis]|nr:sphingomyelin synthase [Podila humilis]
MANVASYLSPDNTTTPKLSDRLFEVIPSISVLWLTDLADAVMFVPTVILVLTHFRPLYLLCKVLLTWALCNLMRITTVAITSFPDPRSGCQHTVGEFFTTFQLHRCGDCMFSGHTVIFVISALVWTSHGYHRFPRRYRWLAWICMLFAWALCIGSAFIVIANRAHYTVDVLVAFYIAGGNWYLLTYLFDRYIEDKDRLHDLTHPWGDGPDPRPHAQEREARRLRKLQAHDPEKNEELQEEEQVQPFVAVETTFQIQQQQQQQQQQRPWPDEVQEDPAGAMGEIQEATGSQSNQYVHATADPNIQPVQLPGGSFEYH